MTKSAIVVDTGPFVALFDKNDDLHTRALHWIKSINETTLFTTVACLTEVLCLLDFSTTVQCDFLEWVGQGIHITDITSNDLPLIGNLMKKYGDLPMDFADATLVRTCEKLKTNHVATFDSDFRVYRYLNRQHFNNVLEPLDA